MALDQYLIDTQINFSAAAAAAGQIKTGAGKLLNIQVQNVNAAVRHLFLFDNTSNTVILVAPISLAASGGSVQLQFYVPKKFATGLRYAASTAAAFALSGTADFVVTASYL
jgi:hypothetical protein